MWLTAKWPPRPDVSGGRIRKPPTLCRSLRGAAFDASPSRTVTNKQSRSSGASRPFWGSRSCKPRSPTGYTSPRTAWGCWRYFYSESLLGLTICDLAKLSSRKQGTGDQEAKTAGKNAGRDGRNAGPGGSWKPLAGYAGGPWGHPNRSATSWCAPTTRSPSSTHSARWP